MDLFSRHASFRYVDGEVVQLIPRCRYAQAFFLKSNRASSRPVRLFLSSQGCRMMMLSMSAGAFAAGAG